MPRKRDPAPEVDRALLENPSRAWGEDLSRQVMSQVRLRREALDLRASDLAQRVADVGGYLPRGVIAKLENGTRKEVTLPEFLLLAAALDVAPLLLLAPLDRPQQVTALPGWTTPCHRVWQWATRGHRPAGPAEVLPEDTDAHTDEVMRTAEAVQAFTEHVRLVERELVPRASEIAKNREQRRIAAAAGRKDAVDEWDREIERASRSLDLVWNDFVPVRETILKKGYAIPEWPTLDLETRWKAWEDDGSTFPWGIDLQPMAKEGSDV